MSLRFGFLALLAMAGILSQAASFYVKQEAAELRTLVRQVSHDTQRLEQLRTREMFARRPAQVEEWASAFETLGPPQLSQMQPSVKTALAPRPLHRPDRAPQNDDLPPQVAPPADDMIAALILQAELSL